MHPGVERQVGAVEVAEAVPEPRSEYRQRPRKAKTDPGRSSRHGTRSTPTATRTARTVATRAAAQRHRRRRRCGGREGEQEEREHPPERPDGLLEAQPRYGDDDERGRADGDLRAALRTRRLRHVGTAEHRREVVSLTDDGDRHACRLEAKEVGSGRRARPAKLSASTWTSATGRRVSARSSSR